jgi:site-specific DNA recombinase
VVHCLDRLSRDPTHGVILIQELEKHSVSLEAVMETVDGTELGKLISYIRSFASKLEAGKIKERTLRGKRQRAKEGKIPHGGYACLYGYDYDKVNKIRIVNETETSWVKQMYEWPVKEGLTKSYLIWAIAGTISTPSGIIK